MKRAAFLKSLVGLVAAPSIAKEIVPVVASVVKPVAKVGARQGMAVKSFVSAIDLLDEREINMNVLHLIDIEKQFNDNISI